MADPIDNRLPMSLLGNKTAQAAEMKTSTSLKSDVNTGESTTKQATEDQVSLSRTSVQLSTAQSHQDTNMPLIRSYEEATQVAAKVAVLMADNGPQALLSQAVAASGTLSRLYTA